MDAVRALEDLTEISSQLVSVAILDRDGSLLASTISTPQTASRFVAGLGELLQEAEKLAPGDEPLLQVDVATHEGSVFALRRDGRLIGATTCADPTARLVLYDLRCCLDSIDEQAEAHVADASAASPTQSARGARAPDGQQEAGRPA